ncbi:helix-turn-helix transcriptional regulator [Rhodopseudomonas sp. RCAM05734]|uniref:helix-turn-helix transcriptional regulator n=1 Tax=Rhodopseudomonas sp. RCAM05734 TaxID=3457549 RepID=UPI004043D2C6
MTENQSPFFLPDEVDKRTLTSDTTRWRREKIGRFPRRIKIGARKVAYRRSEILAWENDPEGWRAADKGGSDASNG